ncbi:hypothetical protein K474DRAFT_394322 [Panus rudis PR-1116 ss-1]|nr:hypothetical protein K474DRAFT_394322 [Panus rudis PR-1116 ss-1]
MMKVTKILGLLSLPIFCTASATINQQILQLERSNSKLLRYPSQLTQNIVPKAIHSHNDYWRDVPLLSAISFGVQSVEADVFLLNGTLFVGHELAALTPDRTLDSLYIQPLLSVLKSQNPKNVFTVGSTTPNGVFDTASDASLQLLIDIKTDGVQALPAILKAFAPLREAGYLTTFVNGTLTRSAVTVVGTGNSPLEQVKALSPRDYFFDAPIMQLTDPSLNTTWDPTLSPIASGDYEEAVGWNGIGNISDAQLANLTRFANDAHERGIKARLWDTPEWPIFARNNIWRVLLENGMDWLNADDLEAASQF